MSFLRSIMFVGTCSDAGKSIINTAFCRIFKQDGYHPAPFKAQNMSLNSYSTPDGLEIGRAQAVQAEACGITPESDMNPVLLKPTNEQCSQVVLNGKPVGNMSAREYFMSNNKAELFNQAYAAYERLQVRYSPIVLEGAGSISEINLRERDITNMRMALRTNAATYLVADIDRGGVFASVYGSITLLSEEERKLIKGIIINKFRGDISLFDEGRKIIHDLTGIPVVGVIPYFKDIYIEEEDSVSLETKNTKAGSGKINVAIVLLKRLSNFTDFSVLERDERFHAYYTNNVEEIGKADIIILPGTKNTISDLRNIRANGIAEAVIRAHKEGKKVIGICGGYQMMGARIEDPDQIEGDMTAIPGLGIRPLVTIMEPEKVTRQDQFTFRNHPETCKGYEIHMGRTTLLDGAPEAPLNHLHDGRTDGYILNEKCWGSYLHGILDNDIVLNELAEGLTQATPTTFNYTDFKDQQYNKLADHVRAHVDLPYIYSTLKTK